MRACSRRGRRINAAPTSIAAAPIARANGNGLAVDGATRPLVAAAVVPVIVVTRYAVSAGGTTMPAAESTHVFMSAICARVTLSVVAFCSATTAALIESLTGFGGAM